jgi:hypothetical protein
LSKSIYATHMKPPENAPVRRAKTADLSQNGVSRTTRWFEQLDRFNSTPFLPGGRRQPAAPKRKAF